VFAHRLALVDFRCWQLSPYLPTFSYFTVVQPGGFVLYGSEIARNPLDSDHRLLENLHPFF
jgi:hypothetical protein